MNRKLHAFWIIPALAVGLVWFTASAGAQVQSAQGPDIIFINGKVVTVNQDFEVVEAVAVKGGRITAVGSSEEIRGLASALTQVVDFGGKTVLPGFNDNHIHFGPGGGGGGRGENWRDIESLDGLASALSKKAEELPTSEWIRASLTRPYFPNDIAPDRHWLDQRVPYHPVALVRGHLMMLNSQGLKAAGISNSTPDPGGGWIIRDETGEPNGQLFENPAKRLVTKHFPPQPGLDTRKL
jgi:predicted amidohydrolase YtcJ